MSSTSGSPDETSVAYAGVLGQAELLRSGALTSERLVELLLARIARLEPRLHAFRVLLAGEATAAAREADRARAAGDDRPLLGVPLAVKDNVTVAGQRAMRGTGSPEPVADTDDELVRRLRAAGLVLVGLTHLPELALWAATESEHHGVTRNPWDTSLTPGGSSGGSAAAVAAGMVPGAHATDGLGSIRIPASACGLVGLKPTHGLVPLGPDPDHWEGLSHAGFVTRSVRDTAALLDVASSDGAVDGGSLLAACESAPPSLRIAVSTRTPTPTRLHRDVQVALDRAVSELTGLGHTVIDRDPPLRQALAQASSVRYAAGTAHDVDGLVDPAATERRTRALAAIGRRTPRRTVAWARREGDAFRGRMTDFLTDVDLLLTPTMPLPPRPAGELSRRGFARTVPWMLPYSLFTSPYNAAGLPAVSLPVGATADGVPLGVQLVGPAHSEALLLQVAAQLETAVGWLDRRAVGLDDAPRLP